MQKSYFSKVTYNAIKGVAVIMLYFLHFFASSDLWLPEVYLPEFQFYEKYFQYSANLCVATFAFLTGYSFWFSEEKAFQHFLKKMVKIIKFYWLFYFILFFVAVAGGIYSDYSLKKVALELLGLSEVGVIGDIIAFFWYMPFYIITLCLLIFFSLILNRKNFFLRDIIYVIGMPLLIFSFLGNIVGEHFGLKRFFVDVVLWFPCAGLGFITARYALFEGLEKIVSFLSKNNYRKFDMLISVLFILAAFYEMYRFPAFFVETRQACLPPLVINMSVIYIFFFIYAVAKLLTVFNSKYIIRLLSELGKYSLSMWLLNGIFFNVFKQYTQPILVFPQHPLLILIWGLVACFILARSFEPVARAVC